MLLAGLAVEVLCICPALQLQHSRSASGALLWSGVQFRSSPVSDLRPAQAGWPRAHLLIVLRGVRDHAARAADRAGWRGRRTRRCAAGRPGGRGWING